MLVGLNLFSMIWARVLRSTHGNSTSTDSAIPGALSCSMPVQVVCRVERYVPDSPILWLLWGPSWILPVQSWLIWSSRSLIRCRVGSV